MAKLDEDGIDSLAGVLGDAARPIEPPRIAERALDHDVGQPREAVVAVGRRRRGRGDGGSPGQSHRDHLGVLKSFT
jgi:hypothetical protein